MWWKALQQGRSLHTAAFVMITMIMSTYGALLGVVTLEAEEEEGVLRGSLAYSPCDTEGWWFGHKIAKNLCESSKSHSSMPGQASFPLQGLISKAVHQSANVNWGTAYFSELQGLWFSKNNFLFQIFTPFTCLWKYIKMANIGCQPYSSHRVRLFTSIISSCPKNSARLKFSFIFYK